MKFYLVGVVVMFAAFGTGVFIGNCYNYYKAHPTEIPSPAL